MLDQEAEKRVRDEELMAQFDPELSRDMASDEHLDDTIRDFDETYVLIYCNEDYKELRKIMKLADLPQVRSDLANARSTYSMLKVDPENIYEFVDSDLDTIKKFDKEFENIIVAHAKAGRKVYIFVYVAGHGCSDVR